MQLPVIDISGARDDAARRRAVTAAVDRACRETGFFCVTGHAVPQETIEGLRAAIIRLFALPDTAKRALMVERGNYRGYIPLGFFSANAGAKTGGGAVDLYEGYKLHAEIAADDPIRADCALYGPNRWPAEVPELREAVGRYWAGVERMGETLLRAFAAALGLDEATFLPHFVRPLTNMTLLHYPPMPADAAGYGIHPHKDTTVFTVLYPDPVGGLELRTRAGDWVAVQAPAGAFVVNVGDILELWSGGRFVSTPHKVVNRSGRERYSFPWFAVPRHDSIVQPLVAPVAGFDRPPLPVGPWQADVWRTNWPDEAPGGVFELGTLPD